MEMWFAFWVLFHVAFMLSMSNKLSSTRSTSAFTWRVSPNVNYINMVTISLKTWSYPIIKLVIQHHSACNVVTRSICVNGSRRSHGLVASHTDRVPLLNYTAYNQFHSYNRVSMQIWRCQCRSRPICFSIYRPWSKIVYVKNAITEMQCDFYWFSHPHFPTKV